MNLRKLALPLVVAVAAVSIPAAFADDDDNRNGNNNLISANMTPCLHDGTVLGGLNSCGKIWTLASGRAKLSSNGKLQIHIKGLVLNDPSTGTSNGTPDGVTDVTGVLICGGSGGVVAAQTARVAMPQSGNVWIHARIAVPATCVAPVIAVREVFAGADGGWLAATGK